MSFSIEYFIEQAKKEGHSDAYILETTAYIKLLSEQQLPILFSIQHFAIELGMQSNFIKYLINQPRLNYNYFFLQKKKKGSFREIMAPHEELKYLQRWLNYNILQKLPYSKYVTGFVPGTSILENAKIHKGSKYLLKIDLLKFFDSVDHKRVYNIFKELGYLRNIAHDLASLCTAEHRSAYWNSFSSHEKDLFHYIINENRRILPQGAPTSPLLANLAAKNLDEKLVHLAEKRGFKYSRYADDLCFSSDIENCIPSADYIEQIVRDEGFFVNTEKTKYSKPGVKQYVTGLSIANNTISVQKAKRREIFSHLFFANKHGLESHLQHLQEKGKYHQNYQNWLFGHIAFHYSIDKSTGQKMMDLYNKINWTIDSDVQSFKMTNKEI